MRCCRRSSRFLSLDFVLVRDKDFFSSSNHDSFGRNQFFSCSVDADGDDGDGGNNVAEDSDGNEDADHVDDVDDGDDDNGVDDDDDDDDDDKFDADA